jgi:hypothetical protein
MNGKIEHKDVVDVDVCNETLCDKSIWCASVLVKTAKALQVELCHFCAGTPRSIANKSQSICQITMCLNSTITNKMVRHFER